MKSSYTFSVFSSSIFRTVFLRFISRSRSLQPIPITLITSVPEPNHKQTWRNKHCTSLGGSYLLGSMTAYRHLTSVSVLRLLDNEKRYHYLSVAAFVIAIHVERFVHFSHL